MRVPWFFRRRRTLMAELRHEREYRHFLQRALVVAGMHLNRMADRSAVVRHDRGLPYALVLVSMAQEAAAGVNKALDWDDGHA